MLKKIFTCLCVCAAAGATAQNYDESKVVPYTLPHLLQTADGRPVGNKAAWKKKRRPEVLRLFEDHVYGQLPQDYDRISYQVTNKADNRMEGKALLKEVDITVARAGRTVTIRLVLFIPYAAHPVPALVLINNRAPNNTDPTRAVKSDFWPAEAAINKGFAIAAFHVGDAAPDDKDRYTEGALQLYPEQLGAGNGMKAIGAWAWAASRVMDYLEREPLVQARKVGLVGHSRGGKAALWAGAQDPRFAIIFSNCSGNTGAALSRRKFGETVADINNRFPHWFSNNYRQYNNREEALPVDQHMLIALIAPRPVYVTNATEDLWADPAGTWLSLLHARPVYQLYRRPAKLPQTPPPPDTPDIASWIGYHNRTGAHNLTAWDWDQFFRFARYHFTIRDGQR